MSGAYHLYEHTRCLINKGLTFL